MSSIDRELDGAALLFDLGDARREMGALEAGQHTARTLLKSGALRVTLITLAAGGALAEHSAPGPIVVQPVEGTLHFSSNDTMHELVPGQLLSVGANVRHAVSSVEGATFLLTVAMPNGADAPR
jgi:quercetin dioxygenase-like cupin family protein